MSTLGRLALALSVVVVLAAGCAPGFSGHRNATARLSDAIPIIAEHKVRDYRDTLACRKLAIGAGPVFTSNPRESSCAGGLPTKPFTDEADRVFREIRSAVADSGITVYYIVVEERVGSSIERAEFTVEGPGGRGLYYYDPGYPGWGKRPLLETTVYIDPNWYFVADP